MDDPAHFQPMLDAVNSVRIERVLDVGCGIGQMLYPLAVLRGATGIGMDPSDQACRAGSEFYASYTPNARVSFVQGRAEAIPFPSESFDAVNCGLALPYTDNARAIAEIARVLRPGGVFLVRIHHARYYLNDLWRSLVTLSPLRMIHAGRVLTAGAIYHLTGRQTETRLFGGETFQTRWLLRREFARRGMRTDHERSDTNRQTPSFVVVKEKESPANNGNEFEKD